jgi:hypothetical protein
MAAGPRALKRRDEALRQLSSLIEPGREEAPSGIAVPDLAAAATVGALYTIVYDEILHGRGAQLVSRHADLLHMTLAPYIGPRAAVGGGRALS